MLSSPRLSGAALACLIGLPLCATSCCGPTPPQVAFKIQSGGGVNDGQTPTILVATLNAGGVAVPDNTQVFFSVDPKSSAALAPIQAAQPYVINNTANTANSKVNITVYDLAVETVTITVTASVTPVGGTTQIPVAGSTTVTFGGACSDSFITPVNPPNAGQSGSGIATFISLNCNNPTMGGSFTWESTHPFEGNTQQCTAFVADATNQGVGSAAVQYLTEAGAFETDVLKPGQHSTELTNAQGEAALYYHVQTPYPEDVPYDPALDGTFADMNPPQPRWWKDATGHVFNPRDGWVSMVAATAGKLQSGSPPISEPYVDANDNGKWDPGEPYIDVNCNGQFDETQSPDVNGYVRIWHATKILWTSQIYPNAGDTLDPNAAGITSGELVPLEQPAGCPGSLTFGETCAMVFRWVDKNLNLPSTMGTGNQIAATDTDTGCSLVVAPGNTSLDIKYQTLVVVPDYPVALTNPALPPGGGIPPPQGKYTLTPTGTFTFCDLNAQANATNGCPAQLLFSFPITGACNVP